jgi:hypothetical protein
MARLTLSAIIASLSGVRHVEYAETKICASPADAEALGRSVADALVARGGRTILEELGRKVEDEAFAARHQAAVAQAVERSKRGVSPGAPGSEVHCG